MSGRIRSLRPERRILGRGDEHWRSGYVSSPNAGGGLSAITLLAEAHMIRTKTCSTSLIPAGALSLNGPLYAQPPGGLTRWMALPWQGDTAFCRSGYERDFDPYLPTFWPARVPNQVLTEESYQVAIDTTKPLDERIAAYHSRAHWLRALIKDGAGVAVVMQRMIKQFGDLGVVEARDGAHDVPELPDVMFVENIPQHIVEALRTAGLAAGVIPPSPDPVVRAGWASEEQLQEFRSVRIRHA